MQKPSPDRPILKKGHNCWRIAPAKRAAVLIDGANYYAHVKVPAVRGKFGPHTYYSFVVSARHLLKIAFVNH
jgi:hypothetical protein